MSTPRGRATPSHERWPPVVPLLPFALVALLGNEIGSLYQYPDIGAAVLFPPYAALTAALVVSEKRFWIWYILVGSLAHLVTHWPQWSLSWVLLADVANVARALTAAVFLCWLFEGGLPRLDGIRVLAQFVLGTVVIAPAIGATLGAANVVLHGASDDYWRTWSGWFVSNALTGLTMLPAALAAFGYVTGRFPVRLERRRVVEAVLLGLALCASCALALVAVSERRYFVLPLYVPLPVLIWAALRFGSAGASSMLTLVAVAAILSVDRGHGPFLAASSDDNILALQVFVLLTSAPVLCLAAMATARQDLLERYRATLGSLREKENQLRTSFGQVRQLADRLMTAQEEERTRIARELHDDFGQRIASLSIGLSCAKLELAEADNDLRERLLVMQQQAMTLSKDLRNLSHELHPGAFEHVGFVEALRTRCDEISVASGVNVRVESVEDWSDLPQDTALCLYRIVQEALRNVVKHAQASNARISIARQNGSIVMRVSDDGQGFQPQESGALHGIGLVSMRERVQMLGGHFEMRTSPGAGTMAEVVLPAEVR